MRIKIDLSEVRPKTCRKCGKGKALFRHHMGNDRFLSRFNKRIYSNYFKYLDCVHICNRCHMKIHFIYLSICEEWGDYSEKGVVQLREKLIGICKLWLEGKVPTPPIPKMFKDRWQKNFTEWYRTRSRSRKKTTEGK